MEETAVLVSAREAAKLLSISERSLWTLTRQGAIPCVRVFRRVLYRPAALAAWAAQQETGGNVTSNPSRV